MTILNWALWGLIIASVMAILTTGGVIAFDKTTCNRHDRATALMLVSAVVGTVAAGIGSVIA
ncbi:hypothetical protein [Rhodococcus sp. KRD197]|uniref:hypothetical protein n=1 Tax=Rhodococcus sp. KRD197 TaxID=2729731 RepID=UPI0019D0B71B|nr:hypothetical protein [Rhodococcus sp. KRD197]